MTEGMCKYYMDQPWRFLSENIYGGMGKVTVGEVRAPGGDNMTSPSTTSKRSVAWKYHGRQEDDSTWKSQGTQNILHRDKASCPKSSWEAVGSFDAP